MNKMQTYRIRNLSTIGMLKPHMSTINQPGEEPTPAEIKAWWNWATKFRKNIDSPFDIDWGSSPGDRTNRHQNDQVYHLAGPAGDGGSADTTARTLQGAKNSGKKSSYRSLWHAGSLYQKREL